MLSFLNITNLRSTFTSSLFLKSIFVVALFLLIFISSVTYKHTVSLTESTQLVVHSHRVNLELEQLISYLKDAETGQRGFGITKDSVFLQPFNGSYKKATRSLKLLKKLTEDSPQQQSNLDSLSRLINIRFAYFDISSKISVAIPFNKNLFNKSLLQGKDVMDAIRWHVNEMISVEMGYLKERQQKYEDEISFTPLFTLLLLLFSLVVFVFSYIKINKDLGILKEANQKLTINTASFKQAEIIGEFCYSQWDLKTKKLTYSDNVYRLLGCEPHSFEPTVENYLAFVHPEDKHIVATGAEKVIGAGITYTRSYRIIRKDGELRYFKSQGQFMTDDDDHKIHIGIIKDVTQNRLDDAALNEKNRELEQNNAELASFNHIASHDLQEPLRKIQLFISRIDDQEAGTMSEKGKEYFAKIENAASRMRALIDDLLLFSRANKSEKLFETTDLTFLLEQAQQELAETIEEKKATIVANQLPVMKVIPFQMQQLFLNLMGNSLKYSRAGVAPTINITCQKIVAQDYPILKTDGKKSFYKIAIADNGLGFDQQYAENIFVLFNRLHNATQYSGTGIGLSICKKIAENHAGFIYAEGTLGVGSTFTLFLPE